MDTAETGTRSSAAWIKFLVLGIFVAGFVAFFILGGEHWLSLDTLKAQRSSLLDYTQQHYLFSLFIAGLAYTFLVALSVPGGVILSLALGMMFGRWTGTALIVCAATLGAVLVFFVARYLFAETLQKRIGGRAKKLVDGFNDNAFNYLLFLRLVPVFPFWLVNLAASALTPVKLSTYTLATFIGIIPGTFVFANLGQSLGRIDSLKQLLSVQTIAALVMLGVFALIPLAIEKWRGTKSKQANSETR